MRCGESVYCSGVYLFHDADICSGIVCFPKPTEFQIREEKELLWCICAWLYISAIEETCKRADTLVLPTQSARNDSAPLLLRIFLSCLGPLFVVVVEEGVEMIRLLSKSLEMDVKVSWPHLSPG